MSEKQEKESPRRVGKKIRRIPLSSRNELGVANKADVDGKKKQKRRFNSWIKEVHKFQKTTDLLIRKLPFCRLVKEVTQQVSISEFRWTTDALRALQEASEAFLVKLLEDGQVCALHARRITIMNRDLQLAQRLRGDR